MSVRIEALCNVTEWSECLGGSLFLVSSPSSKWEWTGDRQFLERSVLTTQKPEKSPVSFHEEMLCCDDSLTKLEGFFNAALLAQRKEKVAAFALG